MRAIVFDGAPCDALTLGQLDQRFGVAIAQAVLALLDVSGTRSEDVVAVGSHGVNVLHAPDADVPVTLQIGDPNQIVRLTGVTTVADFRRRDVALGGQGAPLAPAFHAAVFAHSKRTRVVLNLGGIANVTVLRPNSEVLGFDTGPANGLLDAWFVQHHAHTGESDDFDRDGDWAAGGNVNEALLEALLGDPYFARSAPKSTGKEHFNLAWLERTLAVQALAEANAADVQATLAELTARSVAEAINRYAPETHDVLVCGGGAHNAFLLHRLEQCLPSVEVGTTTELGIAPDHVEAAAFAWLAKRTLAQAPGNLASVTGASANTVLGGVYFA